MIDASVRKNYILSTAFLTASLIVLSTLFFGTPLLYAQSTEPISLEQYRTILADASLLLDDVADPAVALANAEALLNRVQTVQLPSGDVIAPQPLLRVAVDMDDSIDADEDDAGTTDSDTTDSGTTDSDTTDPIDSAAQVEALRQQISLLLDQIDRSADDNTTARLDALQAVFERLQVSQSETLWERFFNWLNGLLDRWFPDRGSSDSSTILGVPSNVVAWTVLIIGGITVAFLLSYWMQGLFGSFVRDESADRAERDGGGVPLTASAARQQATQFAQTGNYRNAVRSLYLSALLSMEESGVVRHDRSLTNREVLRQIRSRDLANTQEVEEHLRPVVDTFDDVWYGMSEPDAGTFQAYEREIDGLDDAVRSTLNSTSNPASKSSSTDGRARRG